MPELTPTTSTPQAPEALVEWWRSVEEDEQLTAFRQLDRQDAATLFLSLETPDRALIVEPMSDQERRVWLRLMEPDDAADVIQAFPTEVQSELLALLDMRSRAQVEALLAYQDDVAGGKMSPRYVRVPLEMTAEQALAYVRLQARSSGEMVYYAYVLDAEEHLLGVVSYRDLILAPPARKVGEIMSADVVAVPEDMDQEEVARLLRGRSLLAVPVVDADRHMRGIITVDDLVDVEREEATEDIQKLGGVEALDLPYFRTRALSMVRKRGGWLSVLFVGQMLTITALDFFETELASAVVLALFIPLIISSGGNAGSQASTLVIRAMALDEIRPSDWWSVIRRELGFGLMLGGMLACLGVAQIFVWEGLFGSYGEDFVILGATVALSLTAVVVSGTLTGAVLPFLLRRSGFDPASASAPLVATVVDVTGVVIYLSVAKMTLLGGF